MESEHWDNEYVSYSYFKNRSEIIKNT